MAEPSDRSAVRWLVGLAAAAVVLTGVFGAGTWWLLAQPRGGELPVLAAVPAFSLATHEDGILAADDLLGRPWIADFIFTHCPVVCPRMTAQMAELDATMPVGVALVSFSVDPENDTPEVLAEYARRAGASARWKFLTASDRETIRAITMDGFLLPLDTSPPPEMAASGPIVHSNRFVLVDPEGSIRGYYDAFDELDLQRLQRDVGRLLG